MAKKTGDDAKGRSRWTAFVPTPMDWVVLKPPSSAECVWRVLWDHRDERGVCWPSMERLSMLSGLGLSTVRRGLGWLETYRYIKVTRGSGHATSRYQITWGPKVLPTQWIAWYSSRLPVADEAVVEEVVEVDVEVPPPPVNIGTPGVSLVVPQGCHERDLRGVNTGTPGVSFVSSPLNKEGTIEPLTHNQQLILTCHQEADDRKKALPRGSTKKAFEMLSAAIAESADLEGSGIQNPRKLTDQRKASLRTLLKELSSEEASVLGADLETKVKTFWQWSCAWPHYRGCNARGWRASLDFLCRAKVIWEVIERGDPTSAETGDYGDTRHEQERLAKVLESARTKARRFFDDCHRRGADPREGWKLAGKEIRAFLIAEDADVLRPKIKSFVKRLSAEYQGDKHDARP